MFLKPKLSKTSQDPSFDLLQEALSQYDVHIYPVDSCSSLRELDMDDIDFLEALELVESKMGYKVNRSNINPHTTINEVCIALDSVRNFRSFRT